MAVARPRPSPLEEVGQWGAAEAQRLANQSGTQLTLPIKAAGTPVADPLPCFVSKGARWADITPVATPANGIGTPATGSLVLSGSLAAPSPAQPIIGARTGGRWADLYSEPSTPANVGQPVLVRKVSRDLTQPMVLRTSSTSTPASSAGFSTGAGRWADMFSEPSTPANLGQPVLMRANSSDVGQPKIIRTSSMDGTGAWVVTPKAGRVNWADLASPSPSPVARQFVARSLSMASDGPPPIAGGNTLSDVEESPEQSPANAGDASTTEDDGSGSDELEDEEEDEFQTPHGSEAEWTRQPCTPAGVSASVRGSLLSIGIPNRPRLGIDIGGVITKKRNDAASKGDNWTVDYEAPGALVGVKRLVEIFGAEDVFLVSKLRLGGSMQRKTEHWLHDTMNFCERTGVIKEHIVFCSDISGPNGKGSVAEELGLSHFIDDKIEVLEAVFEDPTGNSGDLVRKHKGVLLLFAHGGDGLKPPKVYRSISDGLREHYKGVANWAQVLAQLDPDKSNLASRAALELLEGVLNPVRPKLQLKKRSDNLPAPGGFAGSPSQEAATTNNAWAPAPGRTRPGEAAKPIETAKPSASKGLDRLAGPAPSERPKLVLKPRSFSPENPQVAATTTSTSVTVPNATISQVSTSVIVPSATVPQASTSVAIPAATGGQPVLAEQFFGPVKKGFRIQNTKLPDARPTDSVVVMTSPKNATCGSPMGRMIDLAAAMAMTQANAASASTTTGSIVTAPDPAPTNAPARVQVDPITGRPKLQLNKPSAPKATASKNVAALGLEMPRSPAAFAKPVHPASTVIQLSAIPPPSTSVAAAPVPSTPVANTGPARVQVTSDGRPKLLLKKRSARLGEVGGFAEGSQAVVFGQK